MTMAEAIRRFVPDHSTVALGLALEPLIPFAAGHEMIRQGRRDLELVGPISDALFDQLIGAGCVRQVTAAWVGNVSEGLGHCYRRACEELVEPTVTLSDPNRILFPETKVVAVVHEPGGAHPSPVQGFFKRDHAFYRDYAKRSRTVDGYLAWLEEWVMLVPDRATYLSRLDTASLRITRHRMSEPVDYGDE